MSQRKVAVLLSTYNGAKYIEEFLTSLRLQEFENITLIIRDDGSSDSTLQLIDKNKGNFKLNVLPSDKNLGSARSFLLLLNETGGDFDYYSFADLDDVWLPGKISRAVDKLEAMSPEVPALYCSGIEFVDKDLTHLKWYSVPRKVGFGNALVENVATGCTIVINNAARKLIVSKLPENCLMHDWWFYLVVSCFGHIYWDDYSGIMYRQHDNNSVGAATSFWNDIGRRLRRFMKGDRSGVFSLCAQAATFYSLFGADLSEERKDIIERIIRGKASLFHRIQLFFSKRIWRQRPVDDLIMRIVLLINRY